MANESALREGSNFRDTRVSIHSLRLPNTLRGAMPEREFNELQYQASLELTKLLFQSGEDRLTGNIPERLTAAAHAVGRELGWGKPTKKDYPVDADLKIAQTKYTLAEHMSQRALAISKNDKISGIDKALAAGKKEGKIEKDSPIVDRKTHKVEFATFKAGLAAVAEKNEKPSRNIARVIEDIVFPKSHKKENSGKPVFESISLKDTLVGFRAAKHCLDPKDTKAADVFESMEKELLTGLVSKKKTAPEARKKERAAFMMEPIETDLTLQAFQEKVAYAIAKTGYFGPSPDAVQQKLGRTIQNLFSGKPDMILSQPRMLNILIVQATATQPDAHKQARAFRDSIHTLFTPAEIKRMNHYLDNGRMLQTAESNFLTKVLPQHIARQSVALETAADIPAKYIRMRTTNGSSVFLDAKNNTVSAMIEPNTTVLVDAKSMKSGAFATIMVDDIPYFVPKSSLEEFGGTVTKKAVLEKRLKKAGMKVSKLKEKQKTTTKKK